MDVWPHWIRHWTASVDEYSTGSCDPIDDEMVTGSDEWRVGCRSKKQQAAVAISTTWTAPWFGHSRRHGGPERYEQARHMNVHLVGTRFILPIIQRASVSAHLKSVVGPRMNTWGSELWNIEDWYGVVAANGDYPCL